MLIGILGFKYAGKDTTADYLVEKYLFHKLALAQPLKDACQILFNFDNDQLYGSKKEDIDLRWGTSPRIIYQYLGTDIFRKDIQKIIPGIDDNFWVRLTLDKLKKTYTINAQNVVISDVRFQNEIDAIHEQNGIIIKVIRPKLQNKDDHVSEKNITDLKGDYEIINDGTVEDLYKKIDIVFKNIESKWV